jgi:2-hydroxychromene-2-carboxylate isomerase
MKTIDFYLDFISPFAYLAYFRLLEIAERYGASIAYHAIDLTAAKRAAGNTGPPNRAIPPKIRYLIKDLQRWAKRYGVPLNLPSSFDATSGNVGLPWARAKGREAEYIANVWDVIWGKGGDPADRKLLRSAVEAAGLPGDEFEAAIDSAELKVAYERENAQAQARGVFGVPIFFVDDEMFWGNDRLDFLEEHLRGQSR